MSATRKRPTVPRLRGLPASRHGALALALVCAAGAAMLLVFALGQYRQSLKNGTKQDTVLIARARILKGTSGHAVASTQLAKPTPIIEKSMSTGAITDAAELEGKVAARDVLPGEQLTLADFTVVTGTAGQLAPTHRAIQVSLDDPHGLIGVVQPGDRVDVYGSYTLEGDSNANIPVTKLIVPDALVLRAPAAMAAGGVGGTSSGSGQDLLLDVTGDQAAAVVFTAENAKLYLALRPPNAKSGTSDLTTMDTIITGGKLKVLGGNQMTLKFPASITLSSTPSSNGTFTTKATVTPAPPTTTAATPPPTTKTTTTATTSTGTTPPASAKTASTGTHTSTSTKTGSHK